ncbi:MULTISPECIES: pyridoxamine 5'-phosphate oxidase family protein [Pimelobacter]|uniref:pyridoxamine 5'-phosphate oxidase family protein n=1 Tax=Pimelobacter TaxID=2044 RepID=UPI001C03FD86|nr:MULTISPECIES: pyridoxamine 5'-phosphate oxidase family protein [Pimelobacter]MBU2696415.1 pyridoxamine 5'-phosphate oxidase [Pimelobacter sp. 30-1]UUW87858.1 pyridoxamine 5'-phosphate oxidase family protein [Pimelobacter simplex]UUW97363.1 pyridoxamine 5'-phosphate oxidase family protein [Pimelobacter simplex]
MSAGRDKVKLSDEEVQGLLQENIKVQVAANGKDGFPHLTTLFYDVQDGKIAFWTYGRSQKIINLERDPRVTALVEDGTDYFELRGVSIEGRAEIVRDRDRILEIGKAVSVRMFGVDSFEALGEIGAQTVEKQATKRVGVIIHPDRVASWDHRKMT